MDPSPTAAKTAPGIADVAYNMALMALGVALAGLALAYGVDAARKARQAENAALGPELARTIGGRDLAIPRGWFRYAEDESGGFTEQIELRFELPLGAAGRPRPVDVKLLAASRVRPSARLLDGVYLHRFGAAQRDGPPGLIGKPLEASGGFQNETVWYDPLSIDPFVAKCSAPVAADAPSRCIRTVQLAPGLSAVYAFDSDLLGSWKRFDPEMRRRLEAIGVF